MEEEKTIIVNRIQTPDGTILTSYHRHDYQQYIDKNGGYYMVDGGSEYLRRSIPKTKLSKFKKIWIEFLSLFGYKYIDPMNYKELSVYSDAPFEVIRENYHRGGRGKDGKQPLTWVAMSKMSDEWLKSCITYNEDRGLANSFANKMYSKELEYRKENNIFVAD